MPHSLWNGTVTFGMVRVPVKLYSAVESRAVRFHERHARDGAPIRHRRMCAREEREVPYAEIVKGFEVRSGEYVVLSKEEIGAVDGRGAHVIDIEHFVREQEIDPVYYDRVYHLGPGKFGEEPYRLLHSALKRSGRVGIGRFVFHGKAQLGAIRVFQTVLALHTMRFADELLAPDQLGIEAPARMPAERELDAARALLGKLDAKFQPTRYRDDYREAVLALIDRKARGEAIEAPPPRPATSGDELLEALRESVEHGGRRRGARASGASGGRSRSPASRTGR